MSTFWGLLYSLQSSPHPTSAKHISRLSIPRNLGKHISYSGLSFSVMRWLFKLISGRTEIFRSQLLFLL